MSEQAKGSIRESYTHSTTGERTLIFSPWMNLISICYNAQVVGITTSPSTLFECRLEAARREVCLSFFIPLFFRLLFFIFNMKMILYVPNTTYHMEKKVSHLIPCTLSGLYLLNSTNVHTTTSESDGAHFGAFRKKSFFHSIKTLIFLINVNDNFCTTQCKVKHQIRENLIWSEWCWGGPRTSHSFTSSCRRPVPLLLSIFRASLWES